jgi:hypothetical protein
MTKVKAVPPLYLRSEPPRYNRAPDRSQPGQELRSYVKGKVVKNATALLIGFITTSAPILTYAAWVTWRIAEAI